LLIVQKYAIFPGLASQPRLGTFDKRAIGNSNNSISVRVTLEIIILNTTLDEQLNKYLFGSVLVLGRAANNPDKSN
jgi:hypothetical protein